MFCPNCGSSCPEGNHFCGVCGTALPKPAPVLPETPNRRFSPVAAPAGGSSAPLNEIPQYYDFHTVNGAPKKRHRLYPMVIVGCVLGVLFVVSAFLMFYRIWSDTKTYTEGFFSVRNGVLSFDASLYSGGESLTVPSSIAGHEVTSISDGCFSGCGTLEEIILPDTITYIGNKAFYGCISLRGIAIPSSVQILGTRAFSHCVNLEAISLPAGVTAIGESCFSECDRLHFIFYTGTFSQWKQLYPDFISIFTYISCSDGIFSQAAS